MLLVILALIALFFLWRISRHTKVKRYRVGSRAHRRLVARLAAERVTLAERNRTRPQAPR